MGGFEEVPTLLAPFPPPSPTPLISYCESRRTLLDSFIWTNERKRASTKKHSLVITRTYQVKKVIQSRVIDKSSKLTLTLESYFGIVIFHARHSALLNSSTV